MESFSLVQTVILKENLFSVELQLMYPEKASQIGRNLIVDLTFKFETSN